MEARNKHWLTSLTALLSSFRWAKISFHLLSVCNIHLLPTWNRRSELVNAIVKANEQFLNIDERTRYIFRKKFRCNFYFTSLRISRALQTHSRTRLLFWFAIIAMLFLQNRFLNLSAKRVCIVSKSNLMLDLWVPIIFHISFPILDNKLPLSQFLKPMTSLRNFPLKVYLLDSCF